MSRLIYLTSDRTRLAVSSFSVFVLSYAIFILSLHIYSIFLNLNKKANNEVKSDRLNSPALL